jgi:hypothetical protein
MYFGRRCAAGSLAGSPPIFVDRMHAGTPNGGHCSLVVSEMDELMKALFRAF